MAAGWRVKRRPFYQNLIAADEGNNVTAVQYAEDGESYKNTGTRTFPVIQMAEDAENWYWEQTDPKSGFKLFPV